MLKERYLSYYSSFYWYKKWKWKWKEVLIFIDFYLYLFKAVARSLFGIIISPAEASLQIETYRSDIISLWIGIVISLKHILSL